VHPSSCFQRSTRCRCYQCIWVQVAESRLPPQRGRREAQASCATVALTCLCSRSLPRAGHASHLHASCAPFPCSSSGAARAFFLRPSYACRSCNRSLPRATLASHDRAAVQQPMPPFFAHLMPLSCVVAPQHWWPHAHRSAAGAGCAPPPLQQAISAVLAGDDPQPQAKSRPPRRLAVNPNQEDLVSPTWLAHLYTFRSRSSLRTVRGLRTLVSTDVTSHTPKNASG